MREREREWEGGRSCSHFMWDRDFKCAAEVHLQHSRNWASCSEWDKCQNYISRDSKCYNIIQSLLDTISLGDVLFHNLRWYFYECHVTVTRREDQTIWWSSFRKTDQFLKRPNMGCIPPDFPDSSHIDPCPRLLMNQVWVISNKPRSSVSPLPKTD